MTAASRGGGESLSDLALLLRNREHGAAVEQWAAEFLRSMHEDVRIVGASHGGCVPETNAYDIEADGLAYEVKSCMERVRRSSVGGGSQPGRWKIDTALHHGLAWETASRAMYLLVICDEQGPESPKSAYVASHAKMSGILRGYERQGRFVSVTTSVWAPRLVRVYRRPRS